MPPRVGDLGDAERGGGGREVGVRAGLGDRARAARPWLDSSTTASTTTSQSARSPGSVVTRRREGSAPSILAQAATTFSSARQAEASLRASRIVSAVVVETAARPVAIAPLPAIPGAS